MALVLADKSTTEELLKTSTGKPIPTIIQNSGYLSFELASGLRFLNTYNKDPISSCSIQPFLNCHVASFYRIEQGFSIAVGDVTYGLLGRALLKNMKIILQVHFLQGDQNNQKIGNSDQNTEIFLCVVSNANNLIFEKEKNKALIRNSTLEGMTLVFTRLLEFACYHCLRPSQDKITSQVKSDCDVMKLVLNVDEDLEKSPYLMSAVKVLKVLVNGHIES
ncbi:hypothetical protein OUZ56_006265 [Daphnia magna]|uniref:Uncharacterized protein n=1 Tax=Daphnia magna TaxID=35525 RepID=A0ABQ9YV76_9CRUS|nr:hypothetical protein OUZ56_006265 [Daphnia magna]